MSKKFGGTKGRKDNPKAKTFKHLNVSKTKKNITRQKGKERGGSARDSSLVSGSITYHLTVGNHLIGYPFHNSWRTYAGNGEGNVDPKAGWWYPWEIDDLFDNNLIGNYI